MDKKLIKKIRNIIIIVVVIAIAYFAGIKPMMDFHNNEKKIEEAAKRYFEMNSNELPTGERIKTLPLQKLYEKGFLEGDFSIPLSTKLCSNTNSWAKVRRENGEYKYYVYLECGYLKSKVDHEGPVITLNGSETQNVNIGSEYKELGVKKVVDKVDGQLNVKDVVIKGNVNTSKSGTYKVEYIAFDKLNNKSVTTRTIKIVRKIYDTVKNDLGDSTNYSGDPNNNYVRLSNMLFRIYGYDDDNNVILVANGDIANVNYSKLDKWLEYFYSNINDNSKKLIVEKKYCNMNLDEEKLTEQDECTSFTKNKKVYIPSVVEVNNALEDNSSFMQAATMSWLATTKNDKEAYLTRDDFYSSEGGKYFLAFPINDNYGVRPMITIKGDSLIKKGTGSIDSPYQFGDNKPAKNGELINNRECGEYLLVEDEIFRIIKTLEDGTTRVISDTSIGFDDGLKFSGNFNSNTVSYNPNNKYSAAYFINNLTAKYLNTKYFVKHEIEVPIYKDKIIYGKEIDTKKYKVLLSAPNMYEMFSAQSMAIDSYGSYWLVNTSKAKRTAGVIEELGVPKNDQISKYESIGARVVGYLKKNTVITSGDGSYDSPYIIQ